MQSSVFGFICVCVLLIGSYPGGDAQLLARALGIPLGRNQQGFRGQQYQPQPQRIARQVDFYFPNEGPNPNPGFNPHAGFSVGGRQSRRRQAQDQFLNSDANAQGLANNQNDLFNQQAGANTQNQNTVNELGQFQNNAGSSIASNLANDGSSGQLSSANTAQQNFETAQESGSKNAAQSQSLNFDKDSTQATSSNADTGHTRTADSERLEANSGAAANQQTEFGTAVNTAQTNTATFNEAGRQGSQSNANSQSTLQGLNGAASGANTGANSQSIQGPNGELTNAAAAQAAAFSNNGGPVSASASSSSGFGPNGGFTNAEGLANTNGAASNALTQSGIFGAGRGGQQLFANGQAGAFGEAQLLGRLLGIPLGQNQQGFVGQQPQQQYQPQPQQGSVSTADSEAYSRDLQLGNLIGLNGGITKSQSLTQSEDGATNAARTTALTKGLNIGKLGVSSTLTGSRENNNGQVSRGLTENLQIGKLGIESSLSKDNLKNGIGLRRSEDGGVELGLGLLNIDLSRNNQQPTAGQTGTNAQVQAVGTGANVNSVSNTNSQTQQLGKISSTATHSKSNAIGSVLKGFTSGQAGGFAGGAPSYAGSGNFRRRRQIDFYFPNDGIFQNLQRVTREPQFQTQRGQPQQQTLLQPVKNARPGQITQPQFINNNANAQGLANNQNALFNQQAGANTQNQNTINALGQFQNNAGSSIASNLANDGSSGQLSSANTAQQNFKTAQESGSKNAAQSQSLNFDKDSTQATSSNADTGHTKTANSERLEANSGAAANQQTKFGTATNTAQTNTATFNEGGLQGSQSNANSQSTLQGLNGAASGANTGANSQSIQGPNGALTNSAAAQAAAFSNNGGPVSASASSSSGVGPNGGFTNAQGLANTNGAGSNALTQSGIRGGGRGGQQLLANGQANAFGFRRVRSLPQANVEPRTFDSIFNLIAGLFPDTSCNQCTFYVPTYQRNCCPQCCNFRPPPLPQPLPPPPSPPMLPPPPPPVPSVQITSAMFTPWYYQRPCCPTCAPQIGAFPCGRGIGRPFPPPPYYYYG